MNNFYIRFIRLIGGFFLCSLGIVFTINANIGYAPWDVLHAGISKTTGMTIGVASIATGLIIVIIDLISREKIGLGTILNMILIGVFFDIIMSTNIIPTPTNWIISLFMILFGLFLMAIGTYFYISSAFGAGPRDGLMVAFTRKTKWPVGLCRGIIEVLAILVGWKLGGLFGIGTIISAFSIGFFIQITFKVLNFDSTKVKHETLGETYRNVFKVEAIK